MENNNIDLINKFIDNEDLTEEEVKIFKDKYNNDPEFIKEANRLFEIHVSFRTLSKLSKQNIDDLIQLQIKDDESRVKVDISKSTLKKYLSYMSILTGLIAIGIALYYITKPQQTNVAFTPQEEKNVYLKIFSDSMASFYNDVIWKIDQESMRIDSMKDPEVLFNFGLYCYNQNKYDKAIYALERCQNSMEEIKRDSCEFYIALCYKESGERRKANKALEEIRNSDGHKFQDDATEILKK